MKIRIFAMRQTVRQADLQFLQITCVLETTFVFR